METKEPRDEFNERTGRTEYWKRKGHELAAMMGPDGLVKQEFVKFRGVCPCCGTKPPKEKLLWHKDGLRYVRCGDCGMVFIDPILKTEVLDRIYDNAESSVAWLDVLQKQEGLDSEKYTSILQRLLRYTGSLRDLTLLDVGSSYGLFIHMATHYGAKVKGLELCKPAIELAQRRFPALEVLNEKLESWAVGRESSVDVVTFLEVLEHVPDPGELLECARDILKPRGIVVVLVPNLMAKTNLILHEKSKTFGANHLNYWLASTLTRQFERANLEVVETSTMIGDVNTWWNYLNYEDPYAGHLVHPNHDAATLKTLADGQGYKLLAFARKQ